MHDPRKLILLIDDDVLCNKVNSVLIHKKFDHEVEIKFFLNPVEALLFLTEALKSEKYDKILILLDINMPEMTGWEVLEEYGKLPENKTEVNISMLSSSVHDRDIARAKSEPNVMNYFTKPISGACLAKLYEVMG